MSKILFVWLLCAPLLQAGAQDTVKPVTVDKSPMDMSYFPDQYPILKFQGKVTTPPVIRIIYGRPQKEGRVIFGELIRYDEVWRMGANEATEIEFYKDVKIDGKKVPKGRYTMYCIPTATNWTFILNKDTDSWGAFRYDEKKDLLRVKVPVQKTANMVEAFSMNFEKTATGARLTVAWDQSAARLPIVIQ
jgi:Protein of unknown function (DUF2911)